MTTKLATCVLLATLLATGCAENSDSNDGSKLPTNPPESTILIKNILEDVDLTAMKAHAFSELETIYGKDLSQYPHEFVFQEGWGSDVPALIDYSRLMLIVDAPEFTTEPKQQISFNVWLRGIENVSFVITAEDSEFGASSFSSNASANVTFNDDKAANAQAFISYMEETFDAETVLLDFSETSKMVTYKVAPKLFSQAWNAVANNTLKSDQFLDGENYIQPSDFGPEVKLGGERADLLKLLVTDKELRNTKAFVTASSLPPPFGPGMIVRELGHKKYLADASDASVVARLIESFPNAKILKTGASLEVKGLGAAADHVIATIAMQNGVTSVHSSVE